MIGSSDGGGSRPALRMGLVGAGHWAGKTHAPAIAAHPGLRFAGVWGRDRDTSAALADLYGVPAFESADALFEATDIVAFAVAPAAQASLAPRAARAGCHLMLEKPLASSAGDARLVAGAIRAAGVQALVFHTLMFAPDLTGRLDALGATGEVTSATYRHASDALISGPYAASEWRRAEAGALMDIGPHALSVLERLMGPVIALDLLRLGPSDARFRLTHRDGRRSEVIIDLAARENRAWVQIEGRTDVTSEGIEIACDSRTAYGRALDALLLLGAEETDRQIETALRYVTLLAQATTPPPTGQLS
ncbi:Gfo/Idh/MocA family oxidoreductase [Palleronia sp. LCG004]|uniref:Gfo/Idh/MocA family protein n=1 Tax=Palleronia sp. LCG004 TaxID=3079304 RepID=UPI00294206C8|nr:Gfo/Idh/MocA family oxidoreductase [Palleronia sp. LCG004]WOI58306.1 Gfo/Idh/MocA family oxidoreductase [Palleronia sp. LCG004]